VCLTRFDHDEITHRERNRLVLNRRATLTGDDVEPLIATRMLVGRTTVASPGASVITAACAPSVSKTTSNQRSLRACVRFMLSLQPAGEAEQLR